MYTIHKSFEFSAGHNLLGLPEDHPCTNEHGHNYKVIIEMKSEFVNKTGFVKDYRELDVFKNWINENLDHKNLNKVLEFNPTAENIAQFLFEKFNDLLVKQELHNTRPLVDTWGKVKLTAVTVKEGEKTDATYSV